MKRTLRGAMLAALLFLLAGCSFFGGNDVKYTNWEPDMSPDGSRLVYESPVNETLELFILHLETNETEQLTSDEAEDWSPVWSPDGSQIAFASIFEKNADIYVLDLETRTKTRLTTDAGDDINPDWGIDNRIYFNSNRTGVWEIYSIDPSGERLIKITETAE